MALPRSLIALGFAAAAAAQGTIRHDNVHYTVGAIAAKPNRAVDADFSADRGAGDVLAAHWWWYRIDGDPDEALLADDGTLRQRYAGTHADLDWADLDRRGLLAARLGLDVRSHGPRSGAVYARLTLTNLTARPIGVTVFSFVDADCCTANRNRAEGGAGTHLVTSGCPDQQVEVHALQVDRWCAAPFDGGECGIRKPGAARLTDDGLPLEASNYTGAFEWRRIIPPGAFTTCYQKIVHNPGPCPAASSVAYGAPSARPGGPASIATTALPRLGTTAEISVTGARPNTWGFALFGFGRAERAYGNLTLWVLAGPRGYQFDYFALATDGAGRAAHAVVIPNDPAYCGEMMQWQYVFHDPTSAPLPFGHTGAVEWLIGR